MLLLLRVSWLFLWLKAHMDKVSLLRWSCERSILKLCSVLRLAREHIKFLKRNFGVPDPRIPSDDDFF